ncbi:MAG: SpoIIE family protein phosphatase [Planctomycetes bacterium]|nr:SpoIIE family protein phosphatase [Planctomycetota bacterium]
MPASDPKASLEIEQGDAPPRLLLLGAATVRIGRAKENEIHVPAPHVSKQHAEIRFENGGFHAVDVGSRAGVLVNRVRAAVRLLADGDVIELGDDSPVRITFRASRPVGARVEDAKVLTKVSGDFERGGMARLARFFEFSRKLGGGFTLEEVLQDVVDLAMEVTDAERGMVMLRRDDGSLETRVARARGGRSLPQDGMRVSETLVRQAIAHGAPRIVADVADAADLAQQESIMSLELRSAVTLPLVRSVAPGATVDGDHVFGVLYLDSRKRHAKFDGFDLDLLSRLAQDASSVVENARLLREAEDKRRMDQEIETAREVQEALLPESFRSTRTFEVAGLCIPCHELGGDYVDQFDLGNGRQALVIADVCGKGIGASLLAAALQGALAAEIFAERPLGEIVRRVNRVHCRLAPTGKFITMLLAVLEADGTLHFVNAGHCPPLHVHARGATFLPAAGMALGLDEDADYEAGRLQMQPGDAVVLYTDGIVECEGPGRELFGEQRLEQVVAGARGSGAAVLLERVRAAADAFRGDVAVSDDLTLLVVRRV